MAETLPPAVLDLIVNTAEWIAGLEEALAALEEFDAALENTALALSTFSDSATAAMEEVAASTEAATEAIVAGTDEASAAYDRMAEAADAAASATDAAAASTEAAGASSATAGAEMEAGAGAALGGVAEKAGLAVTAVGIASAAMAGDFQAAVTRLVTSAGESSSAVQQVSQGLLDMSSQVGFGATEMAKAMYPIESAGYHAADGLTVMKAAAEGAKDEGADLAHVADAVTTVMQDYNLKASDAGNITSEMVKAISYGKTNFDSFSKSLATVLPIASAVHLSFADVASVEAAMTAHGTTAQRAAMDVAAAIKSLISPTGTMTKEFSALGIASDQVQQHLSNDGLAGTLEWLRQVAEKNAAAVGQTVPEAMKKLIGTSPGLQAALEATSGSADTLSGAIKAVGAATTDANGDVLGFSEVQGNLSFTFDQFKAQLETTAISLGNVMMPALVNLLKMLDLSFQSLAKNTDIGDAFNSIVKTIGDAFTALSPVVAPLAAAFKDFVTVAGSLLVDALKILAPILAVVLTAFDDLMKAIEPLLPVIQTIAEELGKAWGQALQQILDALTPLLPPLTDLVQTVLKNLADILPILVPAWLDLAKAILSIVPALAPLIPVITDFIKDVSPILVLMAKISAALITGVAKAIDFVVGKVGDLIKAFSDGIDWLQGLPDKMKGTAGATRNAMDGINQAASDGSKNLANTLKIGGKNAGEGFSAYLKMGIDNVKAYFKALPSGIAYDLGYFYGIVYKESVKIGQALIDGIKGGATAIVKYFEVDLPGKIQASTSDTANWLKANGQQVISGFLQGIVQKAIDLFKWFNDLPNKMNALAASANTWLYQKGQELIYGFLSGAEQANLDFMKWLFGMGNRILAAFGNANLLLYNVGVSIIKGLWSGINSQMAGFMSFVKNMADSITKGFQDALHINSPSLIMADIVGGGIMEGIAKGMNDNMHLVHGAVGSVRSALTGFGGTNAGYGIGLPAGIGATSTVGGGIVVINNNVQGSVVAEQQLQQLNQTQTLRYNFRNPTNGLSLFGRGAG